MDRSGCSTCEKTHICLVILSCVAIYISLTNKDRSSSQPSTTNGRDSVVRLPAMVWLERLNAGNGNSDKCCIFSKRYLQLVYLSLPSTSLLIRPRIFPSRVLHPFTSHPKNKIKNFTYTQIELHPDRRHFASAIH